MEKEKVYIVDTNVILDDNARIDEISQNGQNIVAIPDTVLLELEDRKKDTGELGY